MKNKAWVKFDWYIWESQITLWKRWGTVRRIDEEREMFKVGGDGNKKVPIC